MLSFLHIVHINIRVFDTFSCLFVFYSPDVLVSIFLCYSHCLDEMKNIYIRHAVALSYLWLNENITGVVL